MYKFQRDHHVEDRTDWTIFTNFVFLLSLLFTEKKTIADALDYGCERAKIVI